jgi:mRNA interferase RelE/StbE
VSWKIEFSKKADKALDKLALKDAERIVSFLDQRIAHAPNPRDLGKPLAGQWAGHWRYRVGDHRILCKIEDQTIIILVIEIGHRREIYR